MPRILVADEDELIRKGLKRFLEEEAGLKAKVTTSDGRDAWRIIQQRRPDLVILDPTLSGLDGFAMVERLVAHKPAIPVLVYTHDAKADIGLVVFHKGAHGYLTKDRPWDELVTGVRKLLAGRKFMADTLVERLASEAKNPSGVSILERLPLREGQILRLIAEGHTLKEIGSILSLVPSTVSTYRARLLSKFGFTNNAQLVRFATENSLLPAMNKAGVRSKRTTRL